MSYVLITPLKDEEKNILTLKDTVFNQTIRPVCWVIVDSGSEDNTFSLSNKLAKENDWINVTKQKDFFEKGYGHLNFSEAINEGYAVAKDFCKKRELDYSYIGKIDASTILSKDYFEVLSSEMLKNHHLSVTCGIQNFVHDNGTISLMPMKNIPLTGFNDIRLYNKEFFEEIGGYPLTPSPDSVILIKALNRKFEVKVVKKTFYQEPRQSGSKIGFWRGYILKGRNMYILGYHPILAFLNSIQNSIILPPHYQFIPMLWGFFMSSIKMENKISDSEIREYYGKNRLREIIFARKGD